MKYGKAPFIAPGFIDSLAGLLKREYLDDDISRFEIILLKTKKTDKKLDPHCTLVLFYFSATLFPTFGATYGAEFIFNTFFSKGDHFICQEITYGRVFCFAKMFGINTHTGM